MQLDFQSFGYATFFFFDIWASSKVNSDLTKIKSLLKDVAELGNMCEHIFLPNQSCLIIIFGCQSLVQLGGAIQGFPV